MGMFNAEDEGFKNPEMKLLNQKIETLELLNHAMWLMLQRLGCSNEEFDANLAYVINNKKYGKVNSRGLGCPACGKSAQLSSDNMRIKCIYCGNEAVLNPYELMDMAGTDDDIPETPVPQEPTQNYAQPYDVSQDLNFDDLM